MVVVMIVGFTCLRQRFLKVHGSELEYLRHLN